MSFGSILREGLEGHDRKDLCKKCGIALRSLEEYAGDKRESRRDVAVKLAENLGLSLDVMCDRHGPWREVPGMEQAPMSTKARTARRAFHKGSREAVADAAGFCCLTLESLELGWTKGPRLFNVCCLADVLGVSLDWLAGLEAPDA